MILDVNSHDPRKTREQLLPYRFQMLVNGKVRITNLRGQVLNVSHAEVVNILAREDLDVHRRKMYEAALAVFEKAKVQ